MIATLKQYDIARSMMLPYMSDVAIRTPETNVIIEFKESNKKQQIEGVLDSVAHQKILLAAQGKLSVSKVVSELKEEARRYNAQLTGFAYALIGDLYYLNKDYKTAVEYYKQALKVPGEHTSTALNNLSSAYICLQMFDKAISLLDDFTKKYPDDVFGWFNRGVVYALHLKKYEESVMFYDEVIRIAPDFIGAWYNKSITLFWANKFKQAIEVIENLIIQYPQDKQAIYIKAIILLEHNSNDALSTLEPLIKNNDSYAIFIKALILESQKKLDEALLYFERSLEIADSKEVRKKYDEVRKELSKKVDLTKYTNCVKIEIPEDVDPTDWHQFAKFLFAEP